MALEPTPTPRTARAWKAYYAREREALGEAWLRALVEGAPRVAYPPGGAMVFPHTLAAVSGGLTAAVARALIESGVDEVIAVGVLHGAREEDADDVRRARAGDPEARGRYRRVHGAGSPHVAEEFSLDAFVSLLEVAADVAGRAAPRVLARYPFLVGTCVDGLPGLDELRVRVERGAAIVGTADPVHHGIGYGTPAEVAHSIRDLGFARARIDAQLDALRAHDLAAFQREAEASRSDFRDVGPVVQALVGDRAGRVEELALVDYADVLKAAPPTWVAASRIQFA